MRRGVELWKIVHRLVCCVVLLLCLVAAGHTEERWRWNESDTRGFPLCGAMGRFQELETRHAAGLVQA
jgi:hypothetical protein